MKRKLTQFELSDFHREEAVTHCPGCVTPPLKLVRRCGGDTLYIGIPNNGAEIDREEARELAIILNRFAKTGHFE